MVFLDNIFSLVFPPSGRSLSLRYLRAASRRVSHPPPPRPNCGPSPGCFFTPVQFCCRAEIFCAAGGISQRLGTDPEAKNCVLEERGLVFYSSFLGLGLVPFLDLFVTCIWRVGTKWHPVAPCGEIPPRVAVLFPPCSANVR